MKSALQAVARAAGIAPAEPRSVVLAGKASRLRERLVKLDDADNGDGSALAAALPRMEREVLEEVEGGEAAREVSAIRARMGARAGERADVVRLVQRIEAEAKAARAEEDAAGEEEHLRELSRRFGEVSKQAVASVAHAQHLLGIARQLEGEWAKRYDIWFQSGGAPIATDGLAARHIITRATALLVEQLEPKAWLNPPAATVELPVPLVPLPEVSSK